MYDEAPSGESGRLRHWRGCGRFQLGILTSSVCVPRMSLLLTSAGNLRGSREVEDELTTVFLLGRTGRGDDGSLAAGARDRLAVGKRVRPWFLRTDGPSNPEW